MHGCRKLAKWYVHRTEIQYIVVVPGIDNTGLKN